jgi:hypothetical protein
MSPFDQQRSTHGKSQADLKKENQRDCRTLKRIISHHNQQKIVQSVIFCRGGQNQATYYRA